MKKSERKEETVTSSVSNNKFLYFLKSPYTRTITGFLTVLLIVCCIVIIHLFYRKLDEVISAEIELNAHRMTTLTEHLELLENQIAEHDDNLMATEEKLLERTAALERNIRSALSASAGGTQRVIRDLDSSYQDLLEAQKRRTLEELYKEDELDVERQKAIEAFAAAQYVSASGLYREIATAHPEDQEARFFQYYSLFLSNKLDQDNYPAIKEAMILLERQGYTREELSQTLEFIEAETGLSGDKE